MTIFSRIIAGEIPCYKIAETENCFAFLDINPLVKGHVLCIPKREVDYLFDLTDQELCDLQLFAKKIAVAQKKVFNCIKVGEAVGREDAGGLRRCGRRNDCCKSERSER